MALLVKFSSFVQSTKSITYAEKDFSDYYHSLDVWHKSKRLKKSLLEVSGHCRGLTLGCYSVTPSYNRDQKQKGMEKVGMWADYIVNHFWWCCWMCERDVEKLKV